MHGIAIAMVGGMPGVVKADAGGAAAADCRSIQKDLVQTYRDDFAKYSGRLENRVRMMLGRSGSRIPESAEGEGIGSQQASSTESLFLPISLKSARVEIELPNGGVLRLPGDVSKEMLVAVTRVVGSLRPWKAPQS